MLKQILGAEALKPWGRTFLQAALPVLVAAGTNFVSVELWKVAVLSGVAAIFAKGQEKLRDSV